MMMKMNLYDSIWALIGPYVAFEIPISVFILTSFMQSISREIEDAAQIDGCGRIRMFFGSSFRFPNRACPHLRSTAGYICGMNSALPIR